MKILSRGTREHSTLMPPSHKLPPCIYLCKFSTQGLCNQAGGIVFPQKCRLFLPKSWTREVPATFSTCLVCSVLLLFHHCCVPSPWCVTPLPFRSSQIVTSLTQPQQQFSRWAHMCANCSHSALVLHVSMLVLIPCTSLPAPSMTEKKMCLLNTHLQKPSLVHLISLNLLVTKLLGNCSTVLSSSTPTVY